MPKFEAGPAGPGSLDAALLSPVPAPSTPTFGAYAPSQRRSRQLYQEWPGNNRFCFDGYIMMGPWQDWPCALPCRPRSSRPSAPRASVARVT